MEIGVREEGPRKGLLSSSKDSSVFTKYRGRRLDFSVSVKSRIERKGERGVRGRSQEQG